MHNISGITSFFVTKKGFFLFVLLLISLYYTPVVLAGENNSITIGVLSTRGDTETIAKWGPTVEYLDAAFPDSSVALLPLEFDEISPAAESGEIDFFITNPLLYVNLEVDHGFQRIATLKESWAGKTCTVFGSVIFTKKGRSDISDLDDLPGKSVMAVDDESFGGWWIAARELNDAGIGIYSDISLMYGGTEDHVVESVLSGSCDVGIVSTGILEKMSMEGKLSLTDIKIINPQDSADFTQYHSTRLYPQWAFSKSAHVSDEVAEKMLIALLDLPRYSQAALTGQYAGWTVPMDYTDVHECMRELKLHPYEHFGEVPFSEAVIQYWYVFLLLGITIATMAGASRTVIIKNRRLKEQINKRDIAEQEKADREKQFSIIASNFPNGAVFLMDSNMKYLLIEGDILKNFGVTPNELIGRIPEHSFPYSVSQATRSHHMAALNGEKHNFEFSHNGRFYEETVLPYRKQNEDVVLVGVMYDITDRKNLESVMHEARMAAEASDRAKSEFLANMSHELRTPLNSVIGFSEVLLEGFAGELNRNQVRYVGNISKSGRHLLNLINEILDLSKVEAGKMEIYYEKFPVSDAFSEIVELVSQLASKKKLSLETEVEQVDVICADKAKFKQILYNLLSNAIKFTPPGGNIRVCATVRGQDLLVSVRDNGIGIAKEDQKKLFNAFTQVDSSSSRNYEGTGLGLSLAKKFVEMHNGRIRVESEPGVGSTFSFTIPLDLIPCAPENDYGLQEDAGQTRKEENVSGESS